MRINPGWGKLLYNKLYIGGIQPFRPFLDLETDFIVFFYGIGQLVDVHKNTFT